ncbi:2-polyprenyl-6-methoxyphenol hydroxylase-like FAD-dependent oxidoreductase [Amycolatopsis echigonensis]|uniref:2-polyprenyl-6-methoxyphenol hydroxylase-like FAD-dependent oxidoreductase n=1 Tax=Amycolatopsis echigonensis TaxID=2576905 RepID=A0A2N3WQV7_9PSEU|nr:FAD-dependent monooxygenase [Amycolatopsis niigatensis]PKV96271.1 2-polyprenyl-6-methoxyphenol hydroxylase-like FAD-dependent oxidoreductase [Amycolatopsis niigatensis]
MSRSVLISGASIAGPALAYWLNRYGFAVTVVEKAPAVRGGGYPIDMRGPAVEVLRRMGLEEKARAKHVATRRITFLDADGDVLNSVEPAALTGDAAGYDIELARGDLTGLLYDAVRDDAEFRFSESIAALDDRGSGVDVTFSSGRSQTFDLVIGADGLHSKTRSLAFGPEGPYHRYLGYCFAGFTMPNRLGLSHEGVSWAVAGRMATLYATSDSDEVHGFLVFTRADAPFSAFADPAAQRDLVASRFEGYGWEVPRMVEAMRTADDLFFDVVSQIHLPVWSKGRVALAGDAAHATSFLSGQGSSLAIIGAYLLAYELADAPHDVAFAAYEKRSREFVEANQALAAGGSAVMSPRTEAETAARNAALRALDGLPGESSSEVHTMLTLPPERATV